MEAKNGKQSVEIWGWDSKEENHVKRGTVEQVKGRNGHYIYEFITDDSAKTYVMVREAWIKPRPYGEAWVIHRLVSECGRMFSILLLNEEAYIENHRDGEKHPDVEYYVKGQLALKVIAE